MATFHVDKQQIIFTRYPVGANGVPRASVGCIIVKSLRIMHIFDPHDRYLGTWDVGSGKHRKVLQVFRQFDYPSRWFEWRIGPNLHHGFVETDRTGWPERDPRLGVLDPRRVSYDHAPSIGLHHGPMANEMLPNAMGWYDHQWRGHGH
jgi:hypothetical protein